MLSPSYILFCRARSGVTLDCQLTFATHISLLSRDCLYQLRQLRTVTRSLTQSAISTLVHAFVANRLDYCCSLYAGLPACRLGSLDRVLRSAARLIGGIPKFVAGRYSFCMGRSNRYPPAMT